MTRRSPSASREPALPLAAHETFRTADLDVARDRIARVFCPHELEPVGARQRLAARHHHVQLDRVGLNYLDYGCRVRIDPGRLEGFYLVQIPLAGSAEIRCGRQHLRAGPTLASLPSPTEPLDMVWEPGTPHLILWLRRDAVEEACGGLLGRPLRRPPVFALGLDLTRAGGRAWLALVELLRNEAERPGGSQLLASPVPRAELERQLIAQLLLLQPHTESGAVRGVGGGSCLPRTVRGAIEAIEARPHEPHSAASLARAAGISARALQAGFRRHLETTPRAYLEEVRLARVRDELEAGDRAGTSVTEVALRWGFMHPSRFAARYRARFGELPSATLRR